MGSLELPVDQEITYWRIPDVGQWLNSYGYSHYCHQFADQYVDGEKLLQLDLDQLADLAVSAKDRLALLNAINRYKQNTEHEFGEVDYMEAQDIQSEDEIDDDYYWTHQQEANPVQPEIDQGLISPEAPHFSLEDLQPCPIYDDVAGPPPVTNSCSVPPPPRPPKHAPVETLPSPIEDERQSSVPLLDAPERPCQSIPLSMAPSPPKTWGTSRGTPPVDRPDNGFRKKDGFRAPPPVPQPGRPAPSSHNAAPGRPGEKRSAGTHRPPATLPTPFHPPPADGASDEDDYEPVASPASSRRRDPSINDEMTEQIKNGPPNSHRPAAEPWRKVSSPLPPTPDKKSSGRRPSAPLPNIPNVPDVEPEDYILVEPDLPPVPPVPQPSKPRQPPTKALPKVPEPGNPKPVPATHDFRHTNKPQHANGVSTGFPNKPMPETPKSVITPAFRKPQHSQADPPKPFKGNLPKKIDIRAEIQADSEREREMKAEKKPTGFPAEKPIATSNTTGGGIKGMLGKFEQKDKNAHEEMAKLTKSQAVGPKPFVSSKPKAAVRSVHEQIAEQIQSKKKGNSERSISDGRSSESLKPSPVASKPVNQVRPSPDNYPLKPTPIPGSKPTPPLKRLPESTPHRPQMSLPEPAPPKARSQSGREQDEAPAPPPIKNIPRGLTKNPSSLSGREPPPRRPLPEAPNGRERRDSATNSTSSRNSDEDPYLYTYLWFHGSIERKESIDLLRKHSNPPDGHFLIRKSRRQADKPYTLDVIFENADFHISITKVDDNTYTLGPGTDLTWRNVGEFVEYFKTHLLRVTKPSKTGLTYLTSSPSSRHA